MAKRYTSICYESAMAKDLLLTQISECFDEKNRVTVCQYYLDVC